MQSAAAACDLGEDVENAIKNRIEARKQALARSVSESQTKTEADEDEEFRIRIERRKQALKNLTESKVKTDDSEEYIVRPKRVSNEPPLKPTSLYDEAELWTLPRSKKIVAYDADKSKSRKNAGGRSTPTNGPSSQWRDKR